MDTDKAMRSMVKGIKRGRGMRWVLAVTMVVVVAGLLGVVIVGFQGRHISRNTDAILAPGTEPEKDAWRPWWLP